MTEDASLSQLVVIGASAGGIEALATLVATLPPNFPAPIVLAQHLDPRRPSHLQEILTRRSTLPVRTVVDRAPLEPGVIFVVPANRHVQMSDHAITLQTAGAGRPMPSVDLLLSSAAAIYGDKLIAVILTGTGSDGAAGARAVKAAGGTVVIQNPDTASYPGMPQALAPTTVDAVANLEQIGPLLYDLLAGGAVPVQPNEEETLAAFLAQVRERNGLDFSRYKMGTIQRRLQRRIVVTETGNLAGYLQYLDTHPDEYGRLVSSFLIKVTEFFRDPKLFAVLRETVLPELIAAARQHDYGLRFWSAGCATGEEAYSLAILVAEALGAGLDDVDVRIFATDVDEDAVAFARRGVYHASALGGISAALRARYFTADGDAYQVKKRVRGLVVFGQHDLGQRPPFPRLDLVLCRNVLIYFTPDLQTRTLQLFAYALRDGGILVLGRAETANPLGAFFAPLHRGQRIYRRQGERLPLPPVRLADALAGSGQRAVLPDRASGQPPAAGRPAWGPLPRADQNVTLTLPVGVAVVDRRYDIQSINGAARRLLAIHGPAIGEDLLHLAPALPHAALRTAIDTVVREGTPSVLDEVAVEDALTGEPRYLRLTCQPQRVEWETSAVELVTIVVTETTTDVRARQALEEQVRTLDAALHASRQQADAALRQARQEAQAEHLRQEQALARLVATSRQLTDANQELLAVNEELRASYEAFQVSTQEAQTTAEEIETVNEEMQATNEELETLNEELQATNEELNIANDDLHARSIELQELAQTSQEERARLAAVLAGMGDAVLVVDAAGTPILTNAAYARLFGGERAGFAAHDEQGQPLPPAATPQARAARGETFQMEFTTVDTAGQRCWYEASGRPLTAGAGVGPGGVVVIRDSTERKAREEDVRVRETRLRLLFEQTPAIIWSTDTGLRLTFAAGAVLATLGLTPDQLVGRRLSELAALIEPATTGGPEAHETTTLPAHRQALAGEPASYTAVWRGRTLQIYVEPLRDLDGAITGTIAIAQDITELSLRRLHDEFIATVSHHLLTPLAAARAGLGLLADGVGDRLAAEDRRLLDNIGRNIGRLGIHLNDLLALNQLKAGTLPFDPQPLDLRAAVTGAMAVVQPLLREKQQELTVALPVPLPVSGDPEELTQALINLLANAHRHTPASAHVAIAGRVAGDEVVLTVSDNGPGIPAGERETIFQRFHRLARPGATAETGAGLGLAIVRGIAELHGGRVWVESAPGEGAAFHVALPRAQQDGGIPGGVRP
ncbi:MAG TPA: chemotaxis protein CheB [Thermomicrobiales bacterium]|nr:chemotaxis protein CheB [Thermomicrobiales bacterium]